MLLLRWAELLMKSWSLQGVYHKSREVAHCWRRFLVCAGCGRQVSHPRVILHRLRHVDGDPNSTSLALLGPPGT